MLGIEVTIIAVVYVIASALMQRRLVNPRRTYEIQDAIKKKTNELSELSKNKADPAALAAKQKEITGLLSESMRSSLKPMFVILPVFLVIYYLVFPAIFAPDLTVSLFSMDLNYKTYFIVIAFVLGFVLSMTMMVYDKAKLRKIQQAAAQEESKQI